MNAHDPTVTVMKGDQPMTTYVVRCGCGLNEQFQSEVQAHNRAAAHLGDRAITDEED